MIAIPAIDLRDGACVQLVGGDLANEQIRIPDPVAVAVKWVELGFRRLHVVDLDAAMGKGSNAAVIHEILAAVDAEVQVGGGVRSTTRMEELIANGARRVVVGTRALQDEAWLRAAVARFPDRIIVAADARGRNVSVNGWTGTLERDVVDVALSLRDLPVASLLVTAIDAEGRMQGPAFELTQEVISSTRVSVTASGGIGGIADLRRLARIGAAGAVVGMALYTNRVDAAAIAQEFAV
jgi:phosphoribosylformimino-5-aminoimidazole carboxamide ribotide isomerase